MRHLVPIAFAFTAACSSSHVPVPDGAVSDGAVSDSAVSDSAVSDSAVLDAGGCPADFLAAAGTPCAEEGRFCGRCIDPCGFCNLLECRGGQWGRLEAPPAPPPCVSFECGPERRCDAVTQYCERVNSDVGGEPDSYRCRPYPDGCTSCDCLPGDGCEGEAASGIMITYFGG